MSGTELIHAGCVAVRGRAVLIEGPSGSGKSDLALRLLDRGATLVSDDFTELTVIGARLFATPPARLAGLIEVRGIGIVRRPFRRHVPVALVATIGAPERMPEPALRAFGGAAVPAITVAALEPSAALKLELALELFGAR